MQNSSRRIIVVAAIVFALSCPIGRALATSLSVSLGTSGLTGTQGVLIFDFIGFAPPPNSVSLSALGGGTVDATAVTMGSVTGTELTGWQFDSSDGFFFDELQVAFTFGSALSFSFTTTDTFVDTLPADFSFSIFNCNPQPDTCIPVPLAGGIPLVITDGPGDALFDYTLGEAPDGLNVYDISGPDGVTITVTPATQAPEPGSLALLAVGLVVLGWRRMIRLASFRLRRLPISLRSQ